MIYNINARGNYEKRLNYLPMTNNDKYVPVGRMLALNNWHSKYMANVPDDKFRADIKKVWETFCATAYRVIRSYVFIIIIRYRAHTTYQANRLNCKFSTNALF